MTTQWVRQIAEGAALATQTRSEVDVYFGLHDLLPNAPLAERMQEHLMRIGAPEWSDEEQAFARECQANMDLPELGLSGDVMPLQPEVAIGGSSDVAERRTDGFAYVSPIPEGPGRPARVRSAGLRAVVSRG